MKKTAPKKSEADRRRKARIPLTRQIRHSTYQVLGTPVFQESSTLDLSSGGISFETTHEYQKGNLVLLDVDMGNGSVRLLVCVAWVKTGTDKYQVGAELVAIDPEERKHLQVQLSKMLRMVESHSQNPKIAKAKNAKVKKPTTKPKSKKAKSKIAKKKS
jgi:hypothetical protein